MTGKFTVNKTVSAVVNLSAVAAEAVVAVAVLWNEGLSAFESFTNDSTFFTLIACLIMGISQIISLVNMIEIPKWVKALKYTALCFLTLTAAGWAVHAVLNLTAGNFDAVNMSALSVIQNAVCPVLCLVSFLFFERRPKIKRPVVLLGIVPAFIYAAVTVTLNVLGKMPWPYPFSSPTQSPIYISAAWFGGIFGAALVIGLVIWKLDFGRKPEKIGS